jgi:predicted dienelactone hydrolase
LVAAALLGACSSDDGGSGAAPPVRHEVRQVEETFVDRTRVTPVNGTVAERPSRTLDTLVLVPDGDGPFPLVVFAHGFGATLEVYEPLLREWAAAGFVVAAPRFPLTYADTPGGINGGDVENQPGDMSFVIDRLLAESKRSSGDLAGVVDPAAIGVAGHSNGGITTLGLIGNSCCRDPRIKAAAVLDGVDSPYSSGTYDLTDLPPTLWVHGTKDAAIGYDEAVRMFNEAEGPKALLSLKGADHGGWLAADSPHFDRSVRTTVDFLRAYLEHDASARGRLVDASRGDDPALRFAPKEGSTVTIATVPPPTLDRKATADDTDELTAGQTVTVTFSGFKPGGTINIVECTGDGRGGSATCDLRNGVLLRPNPTGEGSLPLKVVVGAVGDGTCDASHPCSILVNDSGSQDQDAFVYIPITFAA